MTLALIGQILTNLQVAVGLLSVAVAAMPPQTFVVIPETTKIAVISPETLATSTIFLTKEQEMRHFVIEEAWRAGVNTDLSIFIVTKESQWNPRAVGDLHLICPRTGKPIRSRGLWQINSCAHPSVDDATAFSVESSTEWAMPRLKETPEIWTVYKDWGK